MSKISTAINRVVALFRDPSGNLQPAAVDDVGRLRAVLFPVADPANSFHEFDAPSGNSIASITLPGVAGVRRVVTGIVASQAQSTADGVAWDIRLRDSVLGSDIWGAVMQLRVAESQTVGFNNGFLFSELGADLTLDFQQTAAPTGTFHQTLTLSGYNVFS